MSVTRDDIRAREQVFPTFLAAVVLALLALPFADLHGNLLQRFGLPLSAGLLCLESLRAMPPWRFRWRGVSLQTIYLTLGIIGATTIWIPFLLQENVPWLLRISFALIRTLFFVMTAVRIIDVLASCLRVNGHSLSLGAAGYIHFGLSCGQLATLMQLVDNDSFRLGHMQIGEELLARLSYFAFVTVGTLGYGDVVPGSPVGESFVILVSISSTLYVSLLIGLLLSRYINSRMRTSLIEVERELEQR